MAYKHIKVPAEGEKIRVNKDFSLSVPDNPVIPYIEGDGTGVDITPVLLETVRQAELEADSTGCIRQLFARDILRPEIEDALFLGSEIVSFASCKCLQNLCVVLAATFGCALPFASARIFRQRHLFVDHGKIATVVQDAFLRRVLRENRQPELHIRLEFRRQRELWIIVAAGEDRNKQQACGDNEFPQERAPVHYLVYVEVWPLID